MKLAVNIDHIATLRNARKDVQPDPVHAAVLAELAGAIGIVCHLREDRRHITDRDLALLRQTVKTKLDLEMAATSEMKKIAIATKPDLVTLVPEKREELTTEGGLDLKKNRKALKPFIQDLKQNGIPVSLFIDADEEIISIAAELETTFIEIHTGHFSLVKDEADVTAELRRIQHGTELARKLGLRVVAGHGLNYLNISRFKTLVGIEEVSIGHAIIARAALIGMDKAVRDMISLLEINR
jgi:pyridoxine 5-phosphate synthase